MYRKDRGRTPYHGTPRSQINKQTLYYSGLYDTGPRRILPLLSPPKASLLACLTATSTAATASSIISIQLCSAGFGRSGIGE